MTTTNNAKSSSKVDPPYPRWHNFLAGATAGAGARFITAPLDLIKIRRQLIPTPATTTAAASASSGVGGGLNIFQSLRHIVRTEGGIRSLFRGNVAATYLWIGYAAVQFSLYARTTDYLTSLATVPQPQPHHHILTPPISQFQQRRQELGHRIGSNPTAVAFLSGGAAGTCATLATYPFDLCRTALASRGALLPQGAVATERTFFQAGTTMGEFFKAAVVGRGLFAGVVPAVLQIVPYMGINFALYEYLQRKGRGEDGSGGVGVMTAGMAGAIAGGVSKLSVYPLDTVKKRMQAQAFKNFWNMGGAAGSGEALPYRNMVHCAMRIGKEEGFTTFYRGLVPTVVKSMCGTSVTFAVFTFTKNSLERMHDKRITVDGGNNGSDLREAI